MPSEEQNKEAQRPNFPSITPETIQDKEALIAFIPLAEMIARREMKSMPAYLADFRELVNIGLIKINALIAEAAEKGQSYNPSYISQGVMWEIRNRNRKDAQQRGEHKSQAQEQDAYSMADVQSAVLEAVLNFDEMSYQMADENAIDPADSLELREVKQTLLEAIALLPDNHRKVLELRFFRRMKGVEIADRLGVSSARITRIIADSVGMLRDHFARRKML